MKRATIMDVARQAGVSISTVSNALNNVPVVTAATKAKVMQAVADLHYVPNMMGKQLRSGRSHMIAFCTDSISGPYFYTLLDALANAAQSFGYSLTMIMTQDHDALMKGLLGNAFDGAIILDRQIDDADMQQIDGHQFPAVMLDRVISAPRMSSLVFDSFQAGKTMAAHLLRLGHRHLAYIAGRTDNRDSRERQAGIKQALKEAGVSPESVVVLSGLFEESTSYHAVRHYLVHRPTDRVTAMIGGNDVSAIGAIKAWQDAGYQVPRDCSVVGFDDIEIARYFQPALTTMRNPIAEQGQQAVNMLLHLMNNEETGEKGILTGQLIERDSDRAI